jgi:hypothetical protein
MKKMLIVFAATLTLAVIIVMFAIDRLTYTPGWFREAPAGVSRQTVSDSGLEQSLRLVEQNLLHNGTAAVAESVAAPAMIRLVKARTNIDLDTMVMAQKLTIDSGRVAVEMMVDANMLPRGQLPQKIGDAADRILGLIPDAVLSRLYVKIDFSPSGQDGALQLDSVSRVTIGRMKFSVAELEKKTGLNARDVLDRLGWDKFALTDSGYVISR